MPRAGPQKEGTKLKFKASLPVRTAGHDDEVNNNGKDIANVEAPKAKEIANVEAPKAKEIGNVEQPKAVFKTFTTNVQLQGGLSLIRPLGGGKYEIINIKNVHHDVITSDEAGLIISEDPERRAMLQIPNKEWEAAKQKCIMAVRTANLDVFHFLKLPKDVRYEIYDLLSVEIIDVVNTGEECQASKLMRTCRQIHTEISQKFFWKSTFYVNRHRALHKANKYPGFGNNVQNVVFQWHDKFTDGSSFRILAGCEKLHTLTIELEMNVVHRKWLYPGTRNKASEVDGAIYPFDHFTGFNNLMLLRGLDRVHIKLLGRIGVSIPDEDVTNIKDVTVLLGELLNRVLTQEKGVVAENKKNKSAGKAIRGEKAGAAA